MSVIRTLINGVMLTS